MNFFLIVCFIIYLICSLIGFILEKTGDLLSKTGEVLLDLIQFIIAYLPLIILFIYAYNVLAQFEINKLLLYVMSAVLALLMFSTKNGAALGLSGASACVIVQIVPYLHTHLIGLLVAIILVWFLSSVYKHISVMSRDIYISLDLDNRFLNVISILVSILVFVDGIRMLIKFS